MYETADALVVCVRTVDGWRGTPGAAGGARERNGPHLVVGAGWTLKASNGVERGFTVECAFESSVYERM